MTTPDTEFRITRTIDAPRTLVWQCYTEINHLAQWWGPKGLKLHANRLELKPGGVFLYGMELPDGQMMWGRWIFREIREPDRVVTLVAFANAEGEAVRHPLSPTWPMEMLCTANFSDDEGGKTKLVMQAEPFQASAEERRTFVDGHESMRAGFGGTWDQLDEYLVRLRQEEQ